MVVSHVEPRNCEQKIIKKKKQEPNSLRTQITILSKNTKKKCNQYLMIKSAYKCINICIYKIKCPDWFIINVQPKLWYLVPWIFQGTFVL